MWAEGSREIGFIVDWLHEYQPFDEPQRNEHFHGLLTHQEQSLGVNTQKSERTLHFVSSLCFLSASELFDFSAHHRNTELVSVQH
jgi:hypothetical protein